MRSDVARSLLLIIIVGIGCAAGYYWYRSHDAANTPFTRWVAGQSVLPAVCPTEETDFGSSIYGKIYVDGEKMALVGTMTDKSDTFQMRSASKGDDIYVWFVDPEKQHEDFVMKKTTFALMLHGENAGEASCTPVWFPDDAIFQIPDSRDFKDATQLSPDDVSAILSS